MNWKCKFAVTYSSNSSKVLVDADSTKGQFPTEHVNLVPVEFRFSEQYAAALYCAKRSRLFKREELTSEPVSLAQTDVHVNRW